jgi:hypothetical protein
VCAVYSPLLISLDLICSACLGDVLVVEFVPILVSCPIPLGFANKIWDFDSVAVSALRASVLLLKDFFP